MCFLLFLTQCTMSLWASGSAGYTKAGTIVTVPLTFNLTLQQAPLSDEDVRGPGSWGTHRDTVRYSVPSKQTLSVLFMSNYQFQGSPPDSLFEFRLNGERSRRLMAHVQHRFVSWTTDRTSNLMPVDRTTWGSYLPLCTRGKFTKCRNICCWKSQLNHHNGIVLLHPLINVTIWWHFIHWDVSSRMSWCLLVVQAPQN